MDNNLDQNREVKEQAPQEEGAFKEESVELREVLPKKELRQEDIEEQVRQEMEKINASPALQQQTQKYAASLKQLDDHGKIQRLLGLAKEKGVAFAVNVAKNTGDPYLIDVFHDALIKEGLYRKDDD